MRIYINIYNRSVRTSTLSTAPCMQGQYKIAFIAFAYMNAHMHSPTHACSFTLPMYLPDIWTTPCQIDTQHGCYIKNRPHTSIY